MNKRKLIITVIIILILVLISVFTYFIYPKYKIIGSFSATYIGYDNLSYTQHYIFNKDGTLTNIVYRPDGTSNTYNLGKYKIIGKKITYKNPSYENGFGGKFTEMKYDFIKDVVYEIQSGIKLHKYERFN